MGTFGAEGDDLVVPLGQDEFTAVDGNGRHLVWGQGYGRDCLKVAVLVRCCFCFEESHGEIIAGYGR